MSDKQAQLFAAVLKRLEIPNIDWTAVAAETGYKDASNAKTMFGRFKKRLVEGTGEGSGSDNGVKKSSPKKKPGPKKTTNDSSAEADDEENLPKGKVATSKRGGTRSAVKAEQTEEDEGLKDGSASPKKRVTKKVTPKEEASDAAEDE